VGCTVEPLMVADTQRLIRVSIDANKSRSWENLHGPLSVWWDAVVPSVEILDSISAICFRVCWELDGPACDTGSGRDCCLTSRARFAMVSNICR